MRIGPLTFRLIALVAIGLASGNVVAQTSDWSNNQSQEYYPPGGNAAAAGPIQALFLAPIKMGSSTPYVDAHGNSVVVPAGYGCGDACPDGYPSAVGPAPCNYGNPNGPYEMGACDGGPC